MKQMTGKWLVALAATAALALPGLAKAQNVFDLGLVVSPQVVPIGNTIVTEGIPTSFLDIWVFDLTPDSLLESVQLTVQAEDGSPTIDPTSFDTALFDSTDTPIAGSLEFFSSIGMLSWIPFNMISAGTDYSLRITGSAIGTFGGAYAGTMAVVPVPIPEPETYAMILAGLGLLGFMARRRRGALRA
jgi:hypothetical protein